MTAILCTSCNKENESIPTAPDNSDTEAMSLSLTLSTDDTQTRAFFDNSTSLEAWEKQLTQTTILAVDVESGAILARRDLTSSELQSGQATLSSPNLIEGNYVAVVALANIDVPQDFNNFWNLTTLISDYSISENNGTFAEVAYGSKRDDGFIMTADAGITLAAENNNCNLTLKSDVAKVAMKFSLSDKFNDTYAGSLKVNSVTVSDTPMKIYDDGTTMTHTQTSVLSGTQYQNLFYVLRSSPTFTINATYDGDGNFTTTTDQRDVTYTLVLETDYGTPLTLTAHSYYRITGIINGLDEDAASTTITFTVSDWGSTNDFDVEV